LASQERASDLSRPAGDPLVGATWSADLPRRIQQGDSEAFGALFRRNKERLRRIVAIRLAARLAKVLDEEDLPDDSLRAGLAGAREGELASEAGLVRWLAKLVEREVRRRGDGLAETRERPRTLRFDDGGEPADARRMQREDSERLLDARVAQLEPEEYREVLILRDYCGADWELVRERFNLLSAEAAQELYRRAHEKLARRLRSHLRKQA
jgi:predicted transcriptional regulator